MGDRRGGFIGELTLALPPTLVVLGSLFLIEAAQHRRVLFASLASSAFPIDREPLHPMNGVRVMLLAHLVGVTVGIGAAALLGTGYRASAMAMIIAIVVLSASDLVHPPRDFYRARFRFLRPATQRQRHLRIGGATRRGPRFSATCRRLRCAPARGTRSTPSDTGTSPGAAS